MPKEEKTQFVPGDKCIVNDQFPVAYVRKEGFMHVVRYMDGSERSIHSKWLKLK